MSNVQHFPITLCSSEVHVLLADNQRNAILISLWIIFFLRYKGKIAMQQHRSHFSGQFCEYIITKFNLSQYFENGKRIVPK